jgi:cytochrome c oxidase cbb3-type subunit I
MMADDPPPTDRPAVSAAACHALGWLVAGNLVGLYLSILLVAPGWQAGPLAYGRWVPVHLNVQLYGWTSLPLIAWLLTVYDVDRSASGAWGVAAVRAWSAALGAGVVHWLAGRTSGKIFLDWQDGALWAFIAAQVLLWGVLAAAWQHHRHHWTRTRRIGTAAALAGLALVPLSLGFASSPAVYPPVDPRTGGPTGSSLLGSALVVVGLMLILPRVAANARAHGRNLAPWIWFALSWLVFGVTEAMGGTHHDPHQLLAMAMLLPWIWLLPRDAARFTWPAGSGTWRVAMLAWWGMLVASGVLSYQPGVLDRLKFTQGLVAHSHLAMAGFTTSFCALLLSLLSGRRLGGTASVIAWHAAALTMVVVLTWAGWREGADPSWMSSGAPWRDAALVLRSGCGCVMLAASWIWYRDCLSKR